MTSGSPALRALAIYGLCLPLAFLVGYMLASSVSLALDYQTVVFFGVLFVLLISPLLLRYHHLFLVAGMNLGFVAPFIPGSPKLAQVLVAASLSISVLQRTLSQRMRFLHAPSITRPLLFLLVVVLVTAKFTGGIGFSIFGGQNVGGKKYVELIGAILAYFALSAHRIPLNRTSFYAGFFFLGGACAIISSFAYVVPPGLHFIFFFFPPEVVPGQAGVVGETTRFGGVAFGCLAVIYFLLCRYGIRGLFTWTRPLRAFCLLAAVFLSLFGGFRSVLIMIAFVLIVQSYLEGSFRSRWMPVLALAGVLVVAISLPFVSKLPFTFQRALSFLPVQVDPSVREAAKQSTEWRINIWQQVIPEIPKYLLLGKGYSISAQELSQATAQWSSGEAGTLLAGDYHSGPLSVIIPFGIWGVMGFLWLLWAGGRLLYSNLKFGDPNLATINTLLLAKFIADVLLFLFVFGGFSSGLINFTSILGLSVSLNGGKARPAVAPSPRPVFRLRVPLRPAPGFSP